MSILWRLNNYMLCIMSKVIYNMEYVYEKQTKNQPK